VTGPIIYYDPSLHMARKRFVPPELHDLEREVMDAMWTAERATVREVMDAINADSGRCRAYTTFMTVVHRLDGKGLLRRRRIGKTDHYAPTMTRDEYGERRAEEQVRHLVDQYGEVALSHFAREMAQLDPARRRALEQLAREE
jgi:predicted transcriptional regulator